MAQKDYAEMLCEAVDIIVDEKIKSIQFDKTINCIIIDDTESLIGKYKVTDGSSKFYAYSVSADYKKNDAVYVTVPNGDFNNQKIIAGKQISKNTSPYIFRTPFDTIVDVSTNLITEQINFDSSWLRANDPKKTEILLWSKEYDGLAGFTRLGIQGRFRTWLNSLDCIYGDYGYKLIVDCQEENLHSDYSSYQNAINKIKEENEINEEVLNYIHLSTGIKWTEEEWNNFLSLENKIEYLENKKFNLSYKQYELFLNSQDMYGNPYDFESFYKQEKVFDISGIKQIIKLSLYFYQKPESFINKNKEQLPYKDQVFNTYLSPNLFTKDAYICLGYDIDNFEDDEVTLYTLDSLTYSSNASVKDNSKKIILRWVHNFEDRIKVVSKDTSLDYEVRWYQYVLGSPSADEYSGVYWKRIDNNEFYYNLKPSLSLEQEQIKVIILLDGKPLRSNILTFTNENEVINQATMDALVGLNIWCNDNSYGNYFIYDPGNKLLEQYNVKEAKRLSALFSTEAGLRNSETLNSLLTEATSITWTFPTTKTMLQVEGIDYLTPYPSINNNKFIICKPKSGIKKSSVQGECDIITYEMEDGSKIIYDNINKTLEITRYGNINNGLAIDSTQLYFIKETYSQEDSNNNIQCSIIKDNKTYFTAKSFQFGQAGTTGTDTTLRIYIDPSNEFALDIQQPTLKLKAILYNSENKEIDLKNVINDDVKFEWSWYCYSLGNANNPNIKIVPAVQSEIGNQEDNNLIIKNKVKSANGELIDSITEYKNSSRNVIFIEDNTNTINMDQFLILQCTVKGWGDYDLIAYKPIALKNGNKYSYVDSANEVIYLTAGYPKYYKDEWRIHLSNTDNDNDGYEDFAEGVWEIFNPFNENVNFIGTFKDNVLKPLGIFISNAKQYGAKCKVGTETVWTQPIICLQNNYPSSTLNQWDGKKISPDNEGYILSPAIAAGKKNTDNTFSGVMLGDWYSIGATADDISKQTGVYGFHHGAMSYAFKEDGTAFIGKSGKGRILFNGNESTITSENYKQNKGGILIDLDDGFIDIKNSLNKVKVHLNSKGTSLNPYFSIFGTSKELIHISDAGYFLQTNDYGAGSGVKIDLNNGKITAYDFLISASGTGGTLTINSGDNTYPINVNNKFKIGWDGSIIATAGQIGNFIITDHSIYSTDNKDSLGASTGIYLGKVNTTTSKVGFSLGDKLVYNEVKNKLFIASNIYRPNVTVNEDEAETTNHFLIGVNTSLRLQIGSAAEDKAGYDGISMYGNGGAIYLISTGSTVNEHNAKFGRDEIEFVGFTSHNTKLKVTNIPADNQEGIYARFA